MLGNGSAQGFPSASVVKNLPEVQETQVWSRGWKDPPEEGMAAHCRLLAWRSPWTEEPGGLQPTGSQGVGHDRVAEQSGARAWLCSPVLILSEAPMLASFTALFPKALTVQMVLSGSE